MEDNYHQSLFDHNYTGIYVFQGGKFKYANDILLQWLGYTESEFKNMKHFKLIHPDFRGDIKKLLELFKENKIKQLPINIEIKALKKKKTRNLVPGYN